MICNNITDECLKIFKLCIKFPKNKIKKYKYRVIIQNSECSNKYISNYTFIFIFY